jgi:uncharacterized protein with von Willebrand factor type A (vWA) domain
MAQRMAAMQAMLNSMTPEQRAQLQGLSEQLLEDMDLRWQVDQLGQNLQQRSPTWAGTAATTSAARTRSGFAEAAQMMELGDIDQLENLLRGAPTPVPWPRSTSTGPASCSATTPPAASSAGRAGQACSRRPASSRTRRAARAHPAGHPPHRPERPRRPVPQAGRRTRWAARAERTGIGHERDYDTKPYEFGDPFNLHIERTVRNAIRRTGGGTPVRLTPEDFEVERTEHLVRSATVLMLDLSLSMPMRDNFLPAKKVAMALHSLISSQFPRDYLGIVGFSEVARELTPEQLPEVSWDFVYGTNMQHGFQLAAAARPARAAPSRSS